ncbi:pyridoxamine 5'-phosphate oxidase family protein [Planktothrix sp. FACHB-1355]|uniref:Pyridoxamine 5'-phosphate oxidase family protein n=1 Tax=Aerosakkonema funiforme FACHB-1375 TaxID=2949571 RepID=A0A926VC64_9CYAN|nr:MULTISPECIES: pyridoxamine 5'-phosphate oxidase family protein [Oscillatoriales]MBD2179879.1 pyridoxamine 5'-phosphate oxidase family protein [Aerosakkonema funiforme FACHB-1375]MBD3558664.1 pyridoxamine 5'-phosphate oxidase family protein [Planktothrix sp. FACHB-1355]
MAKFYSELNEELRRFIEQQKIFFTATAPKSGRINLSPKGRDTFRCIDNKTAAYLDLTGSGNETAAHLNSYPDIGNEDNARMTVMFCSFDEKPLILRLYGRGRVIGPRHQEWDKFYSLFEPTPGERQIIVLDIESVQTSCGFGVPIYELKEERRTLVDWAEKKGKEGIVAYWREKNQKSIDGLPTKIFGD